MKRFLLKQMGFPKKNTVLKATAFSVKPTQFIYHILAVAITTVMSVAAYAEQPLSDAELDTKYIEVKIKLVCTKADGGEAVKQSCKDVHDFVSVVSNNEPNNAQSNDLNNLDVLLSGVIDNLRLSGGNDILGIPAGVANTGVPLLFGNENYSYAWSGNLSQIFQPVYYNPIAPYSVYDESSLGFGFREEVHIPQNIPPPTIQTYSSRSF